MKLVLFLLCSYSTFAMDLSTSELNNYNDEQTETYRTVDDDVYEDYFFEYHLDDSVTIAEQQTELDAVN